MQFINPLELLEINSSVYDSDIIKKQKKKVYAEIELSDDKTYKFRNIKFSRSECEKAIEMLDDSKIYQYYYILLNHSSLNNFLTYGDTIDIYDDNFDDEEFIEFISPYFAYQYNEVLYNAFKNFDIAYLELIYDNKLLVSSSQIDSAYSKTFQYIKDKISELEEIYSDIKNENIDEHDTIIIKLFNTIKNDYNYNIYNVLPDYFFSIRSRIAQAIRDLSVAVFNNFDDINLSYNLLEYALKFKVDRLSANKLKKDFKQISDIYEERKIKDKYAPDILKCVGILKLLKNLSENIHLSNYKDKFKTIEADISVSYLNSLPSFLADFKNQVAIGLRNLSIELWNDKNDIVLSFKLIELANKLNINDKETKERLQADYTTLLKIKAQYSAQMNNLLSSIQNQSTATTTTKSKDNSNIGCLVLIIIIGIGIWISNSSNKESSTKSYNNYSTNRSSKNSYSSYTNNSNNTYKKNNNASVSRFSSNNVLLKSEIDTLKNKIEIMDIDIETQKLSLELEFSTVTELQNEIETYDDKLSDLKSDIVLKKTNAEIYNEQSYIDDYNSSVNDYNEIIRKRNLLYEKYKTAFTSYKENETTYNELINERNEYYTKYKNKISQYNNR